MEERDGRERWKREKRGKRGKREREEKEEKLRGQAEFTTQEKKGPHCGPRFSFLNIPHFLWPVSARGLKVGL